jgi:hypothetical protein
MKNFIFKLIFCLNISRHRFKNIRWIMSNLTLWKIFFLKISLIVQTNNEICVFSNRIFNIKFSFDTRDFRSKAIDMSCVRKNAFVIVVRFCDSFRSRATRLRRWLERYLRTKNLNVCSMKFFDWSWWSNISSYFRFKYCKSDMILLLFLMILIFRSYYSNALWITSRSISLFSLLDHRLFSKSFSSRADFCMRERSLKCNLLHVFFWYFFCRTTLLSMRCFSWNCSWWSVVKEWLTTTCWNIRNSSNLSNKFIDWIHWHI